MVNLYCSMLLQLPQAFIKCFETFFPFLKTEYCQILTPLWKHQKLFRYFGTLLRSILSKYSVYVPKLLIKKKHQKQQLKQGNSSHNHENLSRSSGTLKPVISIGAVTGLRAPRICPFMFLDSWKALIKMVVQVQVLCSPSCWLAGRRVHLICLKRKRSKRCKVIEKELKKNHPEYRNILRPICICMRFPSNPVVNGLTNLWSPNIDTLDLAKPQPGVQFYSNVI